MPDFACFLRTALTTSTTGPQVRLVQYFGVAKTTTNGFFAATASCDRHAIELRVGVRRGRQLLQRRVRERRRVRGERRCTHVRGSRLAVDDDVADRLDLAAPDRLGEDPVLAGLVELQVRDEHVLHLAGLRRATRDADRLGLGDRLCERLRLQVVGEPDLCRRPRDDATLAVDDEEREPNRARAEVGRAGDDRDVLAGGAPKRLERRGRLDGRRSVRLLLR